MKIIYLTMIIWGLVFLIMAVIILLRDIEKRKQKRIERSNYEVELPLKWLSAIGGFGLKKVVEDLGEAREQLDQK